MALIEKGDTCTLTGAQGYGMGLAHIEPGTTVVVEQTLKQPIAGAAGEVIIAYSTGTVDVGGTPEQIIRRVAISAEDFQRLFTKAEDK